MRLEGRFLSFYRMCRKNGILVGIVTHNSALTDMADRVIRMMSGAIVSVEKQQSITCRGD